VAVVETCFQCSLNLAEKPGKILDCIPPKKEDSKHQLSTRPLPLRNGASSAGLPDPSAKAPSQ